MLRILALEDMKTFRGREALPVSALKRGGGECAQKCWRVDDWSTSACMEKESGL